MKKYAIKKGVKEDDILLQGKTRETVGDIFYSKLDYLKPNNSKENIILSSDWHMPRVEMVSEKIFDRSYRNKFVGSEDNLSKEEFKKVVLRELPLYPVDKLVLAGVKPGDDIAIEKRLDNFYSLLDILRY